MRTVAWVVVLGLVVAAPAAAEVKGISKEACKARAGRLMKVLEEEKAAGRAAVYDPKAFYASLGIKGEAAGKVRVAQYVNLEDGMTSLPALRTGAEVVLYKKIKAWIMARPSGQTLGHDKLIAMAVASVAEHTGARPNLQAALLTLHNVVRILARPQQWSGERADGTRPGTNQVGHPDTDPARPILLDLLGRASVDAGPTLAEFMSIPRRREADPAKPLLIVGEVLKPNWSMELFNPGGGPLQPQPNVPSAEWNGGAHYYFWIGALAQTTLGTAAVMKGVTGEGSAKTQTGNKDQGVYELTHFVCGAMFGSEAFKQRKVLR